MEALKITAGSVVADIIDKVSFVNHLTVLSEATAENDNATPGYMLDEITDISFQDPPACQQLADYLTRRLDKPSPCVKLKVLKIMSRLIVDGHTSFRCRLRRNDASIKMATMYHGVADPLLGTSTYELVRTRSQELLDRLYDPELMQADEDGIVVTQKRTTMNLGGLGSEGAAKGKYDGFGNSPRNKEETVTEKMSDLLDSLLSPTDETAETIHAAFTSSPGDYAPVIAPMPEQRPTPHVTESIKPHTPGRAGGGWDSEDDDSVSEQPSPFSVISMGSLEKIDAPMINEVDEESIEKQIVDEFCNNEEWPPNTSDLRQAMEKISSGNCTQAARCICSTLHPSSSSVRRMRALLLVECFLRKDLVALPALTEMLTNPLKSIEEEADGPLGTKAKKIRLILEKLLAG